MTDENLLSRVDDENREIVLNSTSERNKKKIKRVSEFRIEIFLVLGLGIVIKVNLLFTRDGRNCRGGN